MIYVNIRGRMGNQLFIYAFARVLQIETGQEVTFNYTSLKMHDKNGQLSLMKFAVGKGIYFEDNKKLPWYANTDNYLIRAMRHFFPYYTYKVLEKHNIYMWLGETYKSIEPNAERDIYIDGFWQCSQYFNKYREIILKEYEPLIKISNECRKLLNIIKNTESICVSVRRGDYVTVPENRAMYYVCDENYFQKGILKMDGLVKNAKWIVFSDDIDWVKKQISFPGDVFFQPNNINPLETMKLMKECKHFIISNSSYSWWGQYLGENPQKIVISPSKWYVDGRKADIIECEWIKIDV